MRIAAGCVGIGLGVILVTCARGASDAAGLLPSWVRNSDAGPRVTRLYGLGFMLMGVLVLSGVLGS